MSYRPKEDGSYVTSDLEGRGDVQAVSIPSNERRRVGARNGIEVRKQRRHRRCSGALLLINLVLPLSQVAAEIDAQEEDQLGVGHTCSTVDRRNSS